MASSPSGPWDADEMFRVYLHDYMIKRGMHQAAEIFKKEAQVPDNSVVSTDMKYFDSVADSHEGFLHEWWSVFYGVFTSRQRKDQETRPGSSSKVVTKCGLIFCFLVPCFIFILSHTLVNSQAPKMIDNARNSTPPRIPQLSMSEQRTQPVQGSSTFNKIMAQQTVCAIPPSAVYDKQHLGYLPENVEQSLNDLIKANSLKFLSGTSSKTVYISHLPHDVGKQIQAQVRKDSGSGMCVGRDIPRDLLDIMQKTMLTSNGSHEQKTNEALNHVALNGWPINDPLGLQNQALASLLQTPSYQQRCQMLKTQNEDAILTQALASTTRNQAFTVPRNSTECNSLYLTNPKTESTEKDKQMIEQKITTVEQEDHQDQQMQMQSQNVENCLDAPDGKSVDENVESFLSLENEHTDHRIVPFSNLKRLSTRSRNENKGFSFEEVGCLHSSKSKVLSSHFSSDGKILTSVGHEKKAFVWNMETFDCVTTSEAHSFIVTDIRFRPGSTIFATSSFDRSVKLWDATRPAKSLSKLTGHEEPVMSLDFHPRKMDLLCSCDSNDVIRLWDVNQCSCMHITKGGSRQVRFQPHFGKFLATATGNNVKIFDFETDSILYHLEGHVNEVLSICWDKSGNFIASISEDSARVWSVASDGKCISELNSTGNKFQSCVFHPGYLNLLVIGGYQSLELWSPAEGSKTLAIPAHKGLIAGLADSPEDELIASASHDHSVKLWK
ncbi:hypothetical protein RJT34_13704 [Clitoria ternatea]|uniref:Uncharacterized protein n=1 Tax=Clitoria ternatea TaxID=43366 RepID=A0AAN9PM20_CLITE